MRVLATHSIRQFPLHFPSRASPCAIRFRTSSTVTGLPTGLLRYHHSISGTVAPFLGPLNLLFERYWRIFLRAVKGLVIEGDPLAPSSSEMKNGVGAHSPFILLSWRPLRPFYFYVTPVIALLDC